MTRDEIIKGIDIELLKKQKNLLVDLSYELNDKEKEDLLDGLVNLLDLIQDNIDFKLE